MKPQTKRKLLRFTSVISLTMVLDVAIGLEARREMYIPQFNLQLQEMIRDKSLDSIATAQIYISMCQFFPLCLFASLVSLRLLEMFIEWVRIRRDGAGEIDSAT